MDNSKRIALSLFALRLSVFIVMFMWTMDKFIRPRHAAQIFEKFYYIPIMLNVSTVFYILGALEILLLFAFLFGIRKRLTYGLVFILHGVSTVCSYNQYFDPFVGPNLLFFAAWPMLAAAFTLYLCRDLDRIMVFK